MVKNLLLCVCVVNNKHNNATGAQSEGSSGKIGIDKIGIKYHILAYINGIVLRWASLLRQDNVYHTRGTSIDVI